MPPRSSPHRLERPAGPRHADPPDRHASQSDVVLAATLHDPGGDLVGEIRSWLPRLQRAYSEVVVATSPGTASSVNELLATRGVFIGTQKANERGPLYRLSLRRALEESGSRIHYLDFDRALHWARGPVRELEAVLRRSAKHPVLLVGRTRKAHASHQEALVATETDTNHYLARVLGLSGRVDFMVPSFLLEKEAARHFLAGSRTRGMGIYGEMALLLFSLGHDVAYVECDGLDWETPDRDERLVRRIGLPAYRARFDSDQEWRLRHSLQREVKSVFDRARSRLGRAQGRIRRLRLESFELDSSSLSRETSSMAI